MPVGIEVRAEGFSHKLPLLAKRLLQALAALTQAHPEDAGVIPMDTTTGTSASGDDAAARAVSGAHAGPSPLAKWAVVKEVLVRKYRNMNLQVSAASFRAFPKTQEQYTIRNTVWSSCRQDVDSILTQCFSSVRR